MFKSALEGKRALVAGVGDDRGFGFAIARSLAMAGATVCAGTWPPAHSSFTTFLKRGDYDAARKLPDGTLFDFERIYALDARFDSQKDVTDEVRNNRRYKTFERFTIEDLAQSLDADFGPSSLDIIVHCIANGPEVLNPLLETSRTGYLEAVSTSSYSLVGLARQLGPRLRPDAVLLCMSYLAGERVVPGYGGGMSSAKAALESDTRVLAFEMGRRYGARVNCISASPWASRAASAIAPGSGDGLAQFVAQHAPIQRTITPDDVASTATFLCSPVARAITGSTVYVDYGSHCMAYGG
ncbi:MAG: enoyl-[acyl-carrier-protein] reductase [Polyangiales bacterium]